VATVEHVELDQPATPRRPVTRSPEPPNHAPEPARGPAHPVTDQDRERAAELLQRACGEGRLTLEEFSERVAVAWAAQDSAALDRVTAGITPPIVGTPPSARTMVNILGDEKRVGRWRLPRRLRIYSLIGDWTLDLRGALVNGDAVAEGLVEVTYFSVIGDLRVIVPEGVEVELGGMVLIGDRKLELAAVPLRPGTPRIKVRVFGLISDVTIRSAA
jgi:hypothetical protein